MVRNNERSLRGSVSSLSLRSTSQELGSQQRIADLEAQIATLKHAAAVSRSASDTTESFSSTASPQRTPVSSIRGLQQRPRPQRTLYEEAERFYGDNFSTYDWKPSNRQINNPEKYNAPAIHEPSANGGSPVSYRDHARQPTKSIDNTLKAPSDYTRPFCDFLTENPTVWHAVSYFEDKLSQAGFKKVCPMQNLPFDHRV